MNEEEKIFAGRLFSPADPTLKAIKLRSHKLSREYSNTDEDETEKRNILIKEILGEIGEGSFIQGPVFFHYGKHTKIGAHCFFNYNLTVQDDALVEVGDNCNFGPNTTIVTPLHPMLPRERRSMLDGEGIEKHLCYAEPVKIGNDCWFGCNVTVCPGVTIGDGCVIGASSVVTRDIPPHTFAAGNPCKVKRVLTDADSIMNKPEVIADCKTIE